jgi:hypothetical protein
MKRSKTLAMLGASGALVLAAALSAPTAIAAVGGSSEAKVVSQSSIDSVKFGTPVDVPPGGHGIATVTCTRKVTGGGGSTSAFDIFFTDSFPSDAKTWTVRGTNTGVDTQQLTAWAVCR